MARRTLTILAGGITTGLMVLVVAGQAPAHGDDSKPVVSGTYTVQVKVQENTDPQIIELKNGSRTYRFGAGCRVGTACTFQRGLDNGTTTPQAAAAGGSGISWHSAQLVDCTDNATGAVATKGGGEFIQDGRLTPSATEVRNGVTYVTQLSGTLAIKARITPKGRADNCTIPPNDTLSETARATLTATLVPLAAPPAKTSGTPVTQAPATESVQGTIPAFRLPQTARQQSSAVAVARGTRSSVPGALVTPSEAISTVADRLPQDLLLLALLGLLIVFPAQLFNSTYEENHERIDRQLARLRPRSRRRSAVVPSVVIPTQPTGEPAVAAPPAPSAPPRTRRLVVFLACVVVGTLLGGLLDPKFGANTPSYALVAGIFVSVLVAVVVAALAGRVFRSATHRGSSWYLQAIPSALLVAVVCVVVSRLTHFEPGYLYGVLGGAVFAAALDRRTEGRAETVVLLAGFVLALAAWVGFGALASAADDADPSFAVLGGDALLASLFIGGLEGLLFGMIPLRFLPGSRVKGWSWPVWGVLMVVVLYVFVHVLLNPAAGYLGRSTTASVTVTLALFVAFAVVSGLFWLWFRLRPGEDEVPPDATSEVEDTATTEPARVTVETAPQMGQPS
jgi:hypothetical protein